MPVHDWTRVADGTFHDFHVTWIPRLKHTLNSVVLPPGYYAMAEQVAGVVPDVLTLQAVDDEASALPDTAQGGGTAVAESPPHVAVTARLERSIYAAKANHIVIRHQSRDRIVAILEVVSAGNKASRADLDQFIKKATGALREGIHLSLIDLHPPTRRDPHGIHGVIWEALGGEDEYHSPPGKSRTLAAYSASAPETAIEAFVDPIAVGDVLPPLPLFLIPGRYWNVPLEESYMQAFAEIAPRARRPLEA
jgi:hypothetical protein